MARIGVSNKKKNIIIVVVVLLVTVGQFIFFFSLQSRIIWRSSAQYSGSFLYTDTDSFNVPPNIFGYNRYAIQASGYFAIAGAIEWGNITFTHVDTNQNFFFEYQLGEGNIIGEDSETQIWVLPSGLYNIIWYSTTNQPNLQLISTSFFFPVDGIVLLVSGFITVIALIYVLGEIVRIMKESSSVKKPHLHQRLDTAELAKGKSPVAPNESNELEEYKYCIHCYSMNKKHIKICTNCGQPFEV